MNQTVKYFFSELRKSNNIPKVYHKTKNKNVSTSALNYIQKSKSRENDLICRGRASITIYFLTEIRALRIPRQILDRKWKYGEF